MELPNSLTLRNVLCVPNFKHNLLSVNKLIKDSQCEVVIYGTHCVIRDIKSKKIKGLGKVKNGLYYLINGSTDQSSNILQLTGNNENDGDEHLDLAISSKTESVPFAVWHHRLGHASLSKLKHIECVKKTIT